MSDLVENHIVGFPTRRLKYYFHCHWVLSVRHKSDDEHRNESFEPPRGKNQQCGFRPGPTQTDLYSHSKELGA